LLVKELLMTVMVHSSIPHGKWLGNYANNVLLWLYRCF